MKDKLAEIIEKNRRWEADFQALQHMDALAMNYEKTGDIQNAIDSHLAAVLFGESTPSLNFSNYARNIERLAILYRKKKDYLREIAILEKALKHEMYSTIRSSYETRLNKAKALYEKRK